MRVAITGATGFLGRYLVQHLSDSGYEVQALYRPGGRRPYTYAKCRWVEGSIENSASYGPLLDSCDAVVHAALWREGSDWSGGVNLRKFLEVNFLGSIELIEAAMRKGVDKFVYISSCAVHDKILPDRPLDENHPLFAKSHYGAHKAAVEAFVHSFAGKSGFDICAVRPTGIYGLADPVEDSRWYDLVSSVVKGERVDCSGGGKEVHAADVARAAEILLKAEGTAGEVYNCYDRYVSEREVADIAASVSRSKAGITGERTQPKNIIRTDKIRALGMQFGGEALLRETISDMVAKIQG